MTFPVDYKPMFDYNKTFLLRDAGKLDYDSQEAISLTAAIRTIE